MLEIFNNVRVFFEDNYRRINVREYARIQKISPPSASKLLAKLEKESLLIKEKERNYIFYRSNRNSRIFVNLLKVYWAEKLNELTFYLKKELLNPTIILFGSITKAEINSDSDIDLVVFTPFKKHVDIKPFEKIYKRKIQLFLFKNKAEISKELLSNVVNGFVISGSLYGLA